MSNFLQITPFMQAEDVAEAVRFFQDILGFKAWIFGPTYAYVERETVGVRIMQASTSPGETPGPGTRTFRYYIDVMDVDEVVAELQPKLEAMWKGKVYGPVDQGYGQREFMIEGPDGDLVVFGQAIFKTSTSEPPR